ncbi:uncharacterized protein [Parasteatoda tepidariorum]|uniref:uncharacterized protein n=1 Tax=Parasteatoda tepidariorum TaxID=114398 RepID=UPI0039BD2CBD
MGSAMLGLPTFQVTRSVPASRYNSQICYSTFYDGWIARFGIPPRITTDQGTQFEASLFDALTKFLGSTRHRTSPYHPAGNRQVERFHRQLKGAIRAYSTSQWTIVSPTILLGIRPAWKEDLRVTTAEKVYGTPIRLPGKFLCPSTGTADPANFVGKLNETMQELLPSRFSAVRCPKKRPAATIRRSISSAKGRGKVFKILIHDRESTVNVDRQKSAYVSRNEKDIFPKSGLTAMNESTEDESTLPEPGNMPN